ncbi:AP-1 complex-associated regulatory protein isoform X3 [Canis lupus baileyi]|uniref:AP-1 complex-associated regulatory protein isoform X3 n=1 Tax=Canis lupus dingo TaxID=286419 RepID=UPI0015F161CF|nr:AP-1 complex-associated regulatory protein isoform X3 [Canis lupus dingo]
MGNCCWTQCFGLLRKEAGRLQRVGGGGGSKYFRTCSRGEHLTIEFENLVESDETQRQRQRQRQRQQAEGEAGAMQGAQRGTQSQVPRITPWAEGGAKPLSHPGCPPLTEEEIVNLRERHYDSIAEKQKDLDMKIQKEQERQRVVQRYHPSNNGEYQSAGPEDDFESCLRNIKSQYEVFRSSRLSSDATVLTPNTESSCDLMTKTKSTSGNDDSTSLDLEWEDEEGMNRMLPMRERSKTEEDILRAALKYSSKKTGSNPTSASDDSNGLEWENDFVSAEMDDNGNSEYSGFVNPVLELSDSGIKQSDTDQQKR